MIFLTAAVKFRPAKCRRPHNVEMVRSGALQLATNTQHTTRKVIIFEITILSKCSGCAVHSSMKIVGLYNVSD